MADEPGASQSKSWWSTLPGLVTAIGGLITAITALVIALHQGGIIGPSTAPTPSPSQPAPGSLPSQSPVVSPGTPPASASAHTSLPAPNSQFRVGVVVADYPRKDYQRIADALSSRGFALHEHSKTVPHFDSSWMPNGPTVFYYADSTLEKANAIAALMKQTIDVDFKVEKGRGEGLTVDEYATTLVVHLNRRR